MSARRNDFFDISGDEDDVANQSGLEEDSKFSYLPNSSAKRRKLHSDDAKSSSSSEEEVRHDKVKKAHTIDKSTSAGSAKDTEISEPSIAPKKPTNPKLKSLSVAQLAASQRKAQKTGVIYISRVPPFMKPSTIRHLLTPYGTIIRLFLTPEPSPAYTKRVKSGGNKKRSFIDGWVEFASKKRAKICAETLNGNNIGGKKGGWYYDDIWNIKYLRGFKWDDLMEQVQDEERIREGRLRAEIQREARERKDFLSNVGIAKRERGMEAKRKKRKLNPDDAAGQAESVEQEAREGLDRDAKEDQHARKVERRFRQNEVREKDMTGHAKGQPEDVKRVLSKIF